MFKSCFIAIVAILIASCFKPMPMTPYKYGTTVFLSDTDRVEYLMPSPDDLPAKLGGLKAKMWPKDKNTFRVHFADGDEDIINKTMGDWMTGIAAPINASGNKLFTFVRTNNIGIADFNVSFTQNNQAWSYVGTDCGWVIKNGSITMNLGWHIRYRNNEYSERFGTGVHEMLHALGYIHTLQDPACAGVLVWNKEVVYQRYARMGWSRAQVDANVFSTYTPGDISHNGCDFKSIMCYQVRPGEANVVVGRNNAVSDLDRQKIQLDYGGSVVGPTPVCKDSTVFYKVKYNIITQGVRDSAGVVRVCR